MNGIRIQPEATAEIVMDLRRHPNFSVARTASCFEDSYVSAEEIFLKNGKVWIAANNIVKRLHQFFGDEIDVQEAPKVVKVVESCVLGIPFREDFEKARFRCGEMKEHGKIRELESSGIAPFRGDYLVISDKSNDLFVFDAQGNFTAKIDGNPFGPLRKFEGIAVEKDWIYVVGDYKNKQGGETLEDHSIGFRFQISAGNKPARWKIVQATPFTFRFDPSHGWSSDPKVNQVKVEGLAVHGASLYIGVRESALLPQAEGGGIILKGADIAKRASEIPLEPYLRFSAEVLEGTPPRPLRISDLSVDFLGNMMIPLSAASDSKWPDNNTTREERFAGNKLLYWSLKWKSFEDSPVTLLSMFSGGWRVFQGRKVEGVALGPAGVLNGFKLVFDNEATLPQKGWPSEWVDCH